MDLFRRETHAASSPLPDAEGRVGQPYARKSTAAATPGVDWPAGLAGARREPGGWVHRRDARPTLLEIKPALARRRTPPWESDRSKSSASPAQEARGLTRPTASRAVH